MSKLSYLQKHYGFGKKKKKKKKKKYSEEEEDFITLEDSVTDQTEYKPVVVSLQEEEIISPKKNDSKILVSSDEDDSDDDLDPIRKRHDSDVESGNDADNESDSDDDDLSPVRKRPRHDSDDDDEDNEGEEESILQKRKREDSAPESERKRQKIENFETIYRDEEGKKISREAYEKKKEEEKKPKIQHQKDMFWARGLVQLRKAEKQKEDALKNVDKEYKGDEGDVIEEEVDRKLREKIHVDDPMAQYVYEKREKKRKKKLRKKQRKSRSRKSGKVKHVRRIYEGSFPPNRFGIRPGFRWDGVSRSNGFEKKIFNHLKGKSLVGE